MAAPSLATVVIACPKCGTRYQIDGEALGAGRLVQCAACQHCWDARPADAVAPPLPAHKPEPVKPPAGDDRMFDSDAEQELDAEFSAASGADEPGETASTGMVSIESIKRTIASRKELERQQEPLDRKAEAARQQRNRVAFSRRQKTIMRGLPMARVRTFARVFLVGGLVLLIAGGIYWRRPIVERWPDLAGVFATIGLPVNVVGLDFSDVQTLEMLSDGALVLTVTGRIVQVSDRFEQVPAVVVTLLSAAGAPLYEWSVLPQARDLMPGETVEFETRLTQPPAGAQRLRLSFANARPRLQAVPTAPPTAGTAR